MHRYIIQVAVLLSFGFSSGWVGLRSDSPKAVEPVVLSSDIQETYLEFQFEGYHMLEVQTPNGTEHVIDLVGGSSILDAGSPDLDKWTSSIIIPDQGTTSIGVISSSYHEYSDISVAPSKGNFSQTDRGTILLALWKKSSFSCTRLSRPNTINKSRLSIGSVKLKGI